MIYIPQEVKKELSKLISFNDSDVIMTECRKNKVDNEWYCIEGFIKTYEGDYTFIADNYKANITFNDDTNMILMDKEYSFEGLPSQEIFEDYSIVVL